MGELLINGIKPDELRLEEARKGLRYVNSADQFTVKKLYADREDVGSLELVIESYSGLQQVTFENPLRVIKNPWRLWKQRYAEGRTVTNVLNGETNHRERTS